MSEDAKWVVESLHPASSKINIGDSILMQGLILTHLQVTTRGAVLHCFGRHARSRCVVPGA